MEPHRFFPVLTVIAALMLAAFNAAAADDTALRRCRSVADVAARLACYDALPVAAQAAAAPSSPVRGAAPAAVAVAAAGAASMAVATAAPVATAALVLPAPPEPVAPAAAAPMPAARFGLEAPRADIAAINSRIVGVMDGWGPRTRFKLANGQVWQVTDDSSGAYDLKDPQVTVRRAAFGSFVLEIEGANRTPRVRRVE